MATIHRPPGVLRPYVPVTPTPISSRRRFVAPQPKPCSTELGLSYCAGPGRRPVHPTDFSAHQRGAGGRCDRLAGRTAGYCPCRSTHGFNNQQCRLEPATATAMAGHFRVRKASSRAGAGDATPKRWPHALFCRGADWTRRAARPACAEFWSGVHATPLGFPPHAASLMLVMSPRRKPCAGPGIPA